MGFVAGVPAALKADAQNSTLFAQAAASAKYNRTKQPGDWYTEYGNVLATIGWSSSDFGITQYESHTASFSVDKVVLEILEAIASGGESEILEATINALKGMEQGEGSLKVFEHASSSDNASNFQVSVFAVSDGVIAMKMGVFYFRTKDQVTNALVFKYKSDRITLHTGSQILNLDGDVFSAVWETIIERLRGRSAKEVYNLKLKFVNN